MYIVAIAWMFVTVMMALAEATSTQGSLLGALVTLLLYGALPLSIVLYVMGAPGRRRARKEAEHKAWTEAQATQQAANAPAGPTEPPTLRKAAEVSAAKSPRRGGR